MSTSHNVEVKLSAIQGLGVFGLRPFGHGDSVSRVTVVRRVTEEQPLRPEIGELFDHCAYPENRVVFLGFPDRHFNHSCDPNAYEAYESGKPIVRARRPILAGEEITLDYNINIAGGDSWPCNCGAARCRGETIGSYFKLPLAMQLEYLPLLADWFVARHRPRIAEIEQAGE